MLQSYDEIRVRSGRTISDRTILENYLAMSVPRDQIEVASLHSDDTWVCEVAHRYAIVKRIANAFHRIIFHIAA